jgi:hypothetical protein
MAEKLPKSGMYDLLGISPGSREESEIFQLANDMYIPGFNGEKNRKLWEYLLPLATYREENKTRCRTYLFWGIAGTGKSTAIRQLTRSIQFFNQMIVDPDSDSPWAVRKEFQNYKPRVPIYIGMGDFRKTILSTRGEENTQDWTNIEWTWLTDAESNGLDIIEYLADNAPLVLLDTTLQYGPNPGLWSEEVWKKVLNRTTKLKEDPTYIPKEMPFEFMFLAETVGLQKENGVNRGATFLRDQCKKAAKEWNEIQENNDKPLPERKIIYTREIIGFVPFPDVIENSIKFRERIRELKDSPDLILGVLKEEFPNVEVLNGDISGLIDRVLKSAPSSSVKNILKEVLELAVHIRMRDLSGEFYNYVNKFSQANLPESYKDKPRDMLTLKWLYAMYEWLYGNVYGYTGKIAFNPLSKHKIKE